MSVARLWVSSEFRANTRLWDRMFEFLWLIRYASNRSHKINDCLTLWNMPHNATKVVMRIWLCVKMDYQSKLRRQLAVDRRKDADGQIHGISSRGRVGLSLYLDPKQYGYKGSGLKHQWRGMADRDEEANAAIHQMINSLLTRDQFLFRGCCLLSDWSRDELCYSQLHIIYQSISTPWTAHQTRWDDVCRLEAHISVHLGACALHSHLIVLKLADCQMNHRRNVFNPDPRSSQCNPW